MIAPRVLRRLLQDVLLRLTARLHRATREQGDLLVKELGVAPSPETEKVVRQMRT